MKIARRERSGVVLLDIDGDIDIFSAYELRDRVHAEIEQKNLHVLLNLEKSCYIDSTGVGVIASTYKMVKRNGGRFKLEKLNSDVRSLIVISGLMKIIEMYDNEDEALASFATPEA